MQLRKFKGDILFQINIISSTGANNVHLAVKQLMIGSTSSLEIMPKSLLPQVQGKRLAMD